MSRVEKPAWRFMLAIAPTLLMLVMIAVVWGNDESVVDAMADFRMATPALASISELFTQYANVPFYFAYAFILARAVKKRDKDAAHFVGYYLVSLVATLLVVYCLKVVVSRPRPFIDGDHEGLFSFNRKFHSFPSNHASETFATTVPFVLRRRDNAFAFGIGFYCALAGFVRIYLGAHYPSDVLGGLVVGCGVSIVCASLAKAWFARPASALLPAGQPQR